MTATIQTPTHTAGAPSGRANGHAPDMHWPTLVRTATDTPTHRHATDTSTYRQDAQRGTFWAVGALALVNGLAVYGQLAYVYSHVAPHAWAVGPRVALSVVAATAFEAIALFVGWHAHDALLKKAHGTARKLRARSYLIAALVATANYSHFAANGMRPTAAAIMFGLVSLLSPWLWGLHTRRAQHLQLIQERRADEVGAEFSSVRRRHFPVRSYMAYRWSIDHGVTDPIEAWRGYNAERDAKRAARQVAKNAPTDTDTSVPSGMSTDTSDRHIDMPRTGRSANGRSAAKRMPRKRATRRKSTKPAADLSAATDGVDVSAAIDMVSPPTSTQAPTPDVATPVGAHSTAAVANAADLRQRYPDGLPSNYRIRTDLRWSDDRVKPARAAHEAGADLAEGT